MWSNFYVGLGLLSNLFSPCGLTTRQVIALAESLAPVGGVFHLAMILKDKWLANQVSLLSIVIGVVNCLFSTCLVMEHDASVIRGLSILSLCNAIGRCMLLSHLCMRSSPLCQCP